MGMNEQVLKMLSSMIGPEEIEKAFGGISEKLIIYKNTFPVEENEQSALMLFEQNGRMYISVCALDDKNQLRQINIALFSDKLVEILKQG